MVNRPLYGYQKTYLGGQVSPPPPPSTWFLPQGSRHPAPMATCSLPAPGPRDLAPAAPPQLLTHKPTPMTSRKYAAMTRMSAGLSIKALCSPSSGAKLASVCSSILPRICPSRDQPLGSPRGGVNGYLRCSELTKHPGPVPPPRLCLAESGHIKTEGWSWGGGPFQVQETPLLPGPQPLPFP